MVDRYFMGKAEKELELFKEKSVNLSSIINLNLSIITSEISNWENIYMTEYYPTDKAYSMLNLAKEVRQEIPTYWYPAEAIENESWKDVLEYYEEHRSDMLLYDYELYYYQFSNVFDESKNLIDIVEKAKKENGLPLPEEE